MGHPSSHGWVSMSNFLLLAVFIVQIACPIFESFLSVSVFSKAGLTGQLRYDPFYAEWT